MGIPYNKYIQFLRSSKKKRRQLACFVTALSVFVSGGVFWQLRGIGTAMVDENLANADDSGEAITVTPLNASELETQDVWEATLPPLTDIAGENLARIAESQLGYSESSVNFVHAEDGETHNGYTRYGAWYGNPYGEWNTMFTYFCLNYAGVSSDDIPYGSGCWAWSLELDKAGLIVPVTRGSPARGDILLIDSDLDGKADRSCIVQSVSDDEISTVEGDIDGSVALTSYLIGDEQLLGMVSLADIVPEPTVLPDEPAEVDFSAESESGICVEAHADRDAFPPDTEMFVFDISQDEAVQAAADHFGDEAPDDIQAVAVDITFRSPDGEELEPAEDSQVRVSIVLPEEQSLTGGEFSLLHISDEGDIQQVENAEVSAEGVLFETDAFSAYVIASYNQESTKTLAVNGQNVVYGSNNPLEIYQGYEYTFKEEMTVAEYNNKQFTVNTNNNIFFSNVSSNTETKDGIVTITKTYKALEGNNLNQQFGINTPSGKVINLIIVEAPSTKNKHIKLETSLGTNEIDALHEMLSVIHVLKTADQRYTVGQTTYIRNNAGDDAYRVSSNDILNLSATITKAEYDSGIRFVVDSENWATQHTHPEMVNIINTNYSDTDPPVDSNGNVTITATVQVGDNTGNDGIQTGIRLGGSDKSINEYFYIIVSSNNETMTHADIEIADGGTYVFENYSFDENGNLVKTITEYAAAVEKVNTCDFYGQSGDHLYFSPDSKTITDPTKKNGGKPAQFVTEDYYQHGTVGQEQYEYTSNYVLDKEQSLKGWTTQFTKEDGSVETVWLRGNKNFNLNDVYRTDFDVDLQLSSTRLETEYYDSNGALVSSIPDDNYKGHTKPFSTVFPLNRQAVLDAYNKCPVHTGLDFTLAAYAVMLDFSMKKEFIGDDIKTNQFEFGLYDGAEKIATAKTDANGIITFKDLYFIQPGTYSYTVKEVKEGYTDVIYADDRTVDIVVTEENGKLKATIDASNLANPLKNYKTYTLPATGGTGELPYILFGSAMLAGAFILLFIRRKKTAAR